MRLFGFIVLVAAFIAGAVVIATDDEYTSARMIEAPVISQHGTTPVVLVAKLVSPRSMGL